MRASPELLTFIIVMAMYRASFTIIGSYVASNFGVGNPPKVKSGPVDEGEEPPGSRWSFFTFSGCTDFFWETGTALTSTWRGKSLQKSSPLFNQMEKNTDITIPLQGDLDMAKLNY